MIGLTVETGETATVGHCDCCGNEFVFDGQGPLGVYVVRHTAGHPERGASMAVSLHGWGEDADAAHRDCVVLEWLQGDNGPGCRVANGADSQWAEEGVLGRMLDREAALACGRAREAFAVADAVWAQDARLADAVHAGR